MSLGAANYHKSSEELRELMMLNGSKAMSEELAVYLSPGNISLNSGEFDRILGEASTQGRMLVVRNFCHAFFFSFKRLLVV